MDIIERAKNYQKDHHLTDEKFAGILGKSRCHWNQVKNGKRELHPDLAVRIFHAIDATPKEIGEYFSKSTEKQQNRRETVFNRISYWWYQFRVKYLW